MKKIFGMILSSAGLLAGCGTNTISENAKIVNEYTESDIGTKLEKVGCELSSHKPNEKQIEITVNNCSTISNTDAITYIKDNLTEMKNDRRPLIFKSGKK